VTRPAASRRRRWGRMGFACSERRADISGTDTGRPASRTYRYRRNRVSSASALWISGDRAGDIVAHYAPGAPPAAPAVSSSVPANPLVRPHHPNSLREEAMPTTEEEV